MTEFVMLAKKYKEQNPAGWLMSEKLDGVRATWDGKEFRSRENNVFYAPAWFKKGMPRNVKIDGELWVGRGMFQKTVSKIKQHNNEWKGVKFRVFDVVTMKNFSVRYLRLCHMITKMPDHCVLVKHTSCRSMSHLLKYEAKILKLGGEGVMLRNPQSKYEYKHSNNLLKVKRPDSSEATVTGHIKGTGRNANRMGKLVCSWGDKTIKIGTGFSDGERDDPPPLGSCVTFEYYGLTDSGQPRHSAYIEIRDYE